MKLLSLPFRSALLATQLSFFLHQTSPDAATEASEYCKHPYPFLFPTINLRCSQASKPPSRSPRNSISALYPSMSITCNSRLHAVSDHPSLSRNRSRFNIPVAFLRSRSDKRSNSAPELSLLLLWSEEAGAIFPLLMRSSPSRSSWSVERRRSELWSPSQRMERTLWLAFSCDSVQEPCL